MLDLEKLGWEAGSVGELDHRLLTAPHVKLRSAIAGEHGDVVYSVDLRITRPNTEYLSTTEFHSIEHLLLAGFRKYMLDHFISVAPMGCQTGFYLVLLNEGDAQRICGVYENILNDILAAGEVPYARAQDCGNYRNHDLALAQVVARRVLADRSSWLQVV